MKANEVKEILEEVFFSVSIEGDKEQHRILWEAITKVHHEIGERAGKNSPRFLPSKDWYSGIFEYSPFKRNYDSRKGVK